MPKNFRPGVDDPFTWDPDEDSVPAPSDEVPEPSQDEKPPFLKPYHLKKDRGELELIKMTDETSEFSDVVLLVGVGRTRYRLGLKLFSPDYKSLVKRFGKKKEDWHGELSYKVMPHKTNPRGYVAVR